MSFTSLHFASLVCLLYLSGGRDANSENLGLENLGVVTLKYGRIKIDEDYRTTSETSIYAIGDVIGPPGLASAAIQQGRYVADKLFGSQSMTYNEEWWKEKSNPGANKGILFGSAKGKGSIDAPLTLWTIPELSSVGNKIFLLSYHFLVNNILPTSGCGVYVCTFLQFLLSYSIIPIFNNFIRKKQDRGITSIWGQCYYH